MDPSLARDVEEARALLAEARRIVVVTGAGISAESGVPTFRGPEGLWRNHRPEELATPQAFRRDPRLVWAWYGWRRSLVAGCSPNPGHRALARLALSRERRVTLVTQNVDHLHEMAAEEAGASAPPPPILKLHGSLFVDRCTRCRRRSDGVATGDVTSIGSHPRCPACGGLLRPDVVWFGEALDATILQTAFQEAAAADVCLAVGTSGVVHPAASVPLATARAGGLFIEVNPDESALSPVATVVLRGPSGTVLPQLLA